MPFPSDIIKKLTVYNQNTGLSENNLVGYNLLEDNINLSSNNNSYSSPRLLNWTAPYPINGVNKTLFYTEVNTNFTVGDRVFIINGNYDSNNLISIDKYKKGRDGYSVLFVDKCRIVLDINYNGILPFNDNEENFIKIWKVNSREDFISFSRQLTTKDKSLNFKFQDGLGHVIYTDKIYDKVYTEIDSNNNYITGWGVNLGVNGSVPGFFVKNTFNYWKNITNELFYYGTYYPNKKIKIMNGDIVFNGFTLRDGDVYEWTKGKTSSYWTLSKESLEPIITKSNFRGGQFKGVFNSGVFGGNTKKLSWDPNYTFNGGTIYNSNFKGVINSNISINESWKATLKEGKPYEQLNVLNNGGYGYNYIINSELSESNIINANLIGLKIGNFDSTFVKNNPVLENHIIGKTQSYSNNTIESANFENCIFSTIELDNCTLLNSRVYNSKITNGNIVNSQISSSVIKDSIYTTQDSIKVLYYDEWNISVNNFISLTDSNIYSTYSIYSIAQLNTSTENKTRTTHKIYKFYIDKTSYQKVKHGEYFYIKGVTYKDSPKILVNFFDKKFKIGTWTEYIDDFKNNDFYKRGFEITSYLSTPSDNSYIINSFTGTKPIVGKSIYIQSNKTFTNKYSDYYSIDVVISLSDLNGLTYSYLDFNYSSSVTQSGNRTFLLDKIDISNAYIIDANFESGLFENSDWNSGNHINYNNDNLISNLNGTGTYSFILDQNLNRLEVTLPKNSISEFELELDEVVYLNSVDHILNGVVTRLGDTFKVEKIEGKKITLSELNTSTLNPLISKNSQFKTDKSENRWNYLSKTKFFKSKIKSGLFKRSYFNNSLIKNDEYNSNDRDFENINKIKSLIISDSIFSKTKNILSKATYINTFFINNDDILEDLIIYNSYLNDVVFSKGIVKESFWKNGIFNGGLFYNSKSFDGMSSLKYPNYNTMRLKSYFRIGSGDNNRWSWSDGTFNGGEFYKSDWENGVFTGGLFNYSKFYNGTFSGGILGDKYGSSNDTLVYNGDILYTTVNNANLFSNDVSHSKNTPSTINWYNGVFNNGLFGSYADISYSSIPYSSTITITKNKNEDIIGTFSFTNINIDTDYEIKLDLYLDVPGQNDTRLLLVNLKGPNGKIINIKGYNEGFNNITAMTFSSSDIYPHISQFSQSKNNNIVRMSKNINSTPFRSPNFKSNISNIKEAYNENPNGDWVIIIGSGIEKDYSYTGIKCTLKITISKLNNLVIKNKSIWHNGEFNGGEFLNYSKWKNGIFNGGIFTSTLGWTQSGKYYDNSRIIDDYTWENGIFNDGEFGNKSIYSNSTWYNGVFNGGQFRGKLWNNGVFLYGNFIGSSIHSAHGNLDILKFNLSNASKFTNSFKKNFYGLWVNGIVSNDRQKYVLNSDNSVFRKWNNSNLQNFLWRDGIFNHEDSIIDNSVWLSGTFSNGTFINSSFNPYVDRSTKTNNEDYKFTPDINPTSTTFIDNSVWENGVLMDSDFYVSKWYNGTFINGNAFSMVFLGGVSKFMNAYNVIWEGGKWENGNWYGSNLSYSGTYNNNFIYSILRRGLKNYGENLSDNMIHIWNLFESENNNNFRLYGDISKNISNDVLVNEKSSNSPSTTTEAAIVTTNGMFDNGSFGGLPTWNEEVFDGTNFFNFVSDGPTNVGSYTPSRNYRVD